MDNAGRDRGCSLPLQRGTREERMTDGRKQRGEPGHQSKIIFHRKPNKYDLNLYRSSPLTPPPPPAPNISIPLYQTPTVPGISTYSHQQDACSTRSSTNSMESVPSYINCPFCPVFLSLPSLPLHLSSAHPEDLFRCQVPGPDGRLCSQSGFMLASELQVHLFSQHHQHTFSVDKLVRDRQILLPTDLRQYCCKLCLNTTFHGKEGIREAQEHLKKVHSRNEGVNLLAYQCRACQNCKFESVKILEKHIKHRHSKNDNSQNRRRPSVDVVKSDNCGQVYKSSLQTSTLEQQDTKASALDQEAPNESSVQVTRPSPPTSRVGVVAVPLEPDVVAVAVEQGLQRCDLCPSPGLVQRLDIHLGRSHRDAMFTCAPCGKGFLLLAELAEHIVTDHSVTDNVLGRVLLPSEDLLLAQQCGLCTRQGFGTESRAVIESHIFSSHKEGEIMGVCRVCDFTSSEENVVRDHIEEEHPKEMFAVESESEDENANIKQDREPTTEPFMDRFSELCKKKKLENKERRGCERKMNKELRDSSLDRSTSSEEDKEVVWIGGKPKKLSGEEFRNHMMMEISMNVFVKKFQTFRVEKTKMDSISSGRNKIGKIKKNCSRKKKKTKGKLQKHLTAYIKTEADGDQYIKTQASLPSWAAGELSKLEDELKQALERSRRITFKIRRRGGE